VFHGLKTGFFCYSLKLNFICYPNRFFTYDYSLWDGGDIRFCGQKQTLIKVKMNMNNEHLTVKAISIVHFYINFTNHLYFFFKEKYYRYMKQYLIIL
jgi:hypothetical protein